MQNDTFKIEIAKTDYYGKQFSRNSIKLETLVEIDKLHGASGVKDALYEMYQQVLESQSYQ